jgi:hypothetical protein
VSWHPCCCGGNTTCCPGVTIPNTLYATISSPGCACFDGQVVTLTYNAISFKWEGTLSGICANGADVHVLTFKVACSGSSAADWNLEITNFTAGDGGADSPCMFNQFPTAVTEVCNPFELVYSGTIQSVPSFLACPDAGDAYTITVTE